MSNPLGVFDAHHRTTTFSITLGMSLVAFESLAITTIAPTFAEALDGMTLYGWTFSSFLLMSLLSIILAGPHIDRNGPWPALAVGLILFGSGLLISGLAPTMLVLLVGRALQGLGGGAVNTALYASVNLAYPDALRPRMMALLSTAWILPTLVGPVLAGFIADVTTWRAVFVGIVPLVVLLAALTAPTFRRLQRDARAKAPAVGDWLGAFQATLGAGLFLLGLSTPAPVIALALTAFGALLGLPALSRLLPRETFRAKPGLATVLASRAFFTAAFTAVQIFLAVFVTNVQGFSSSIAGIVIATGSISWTLGAWLQERRDRQQGGAGRPGRVLIGTLTLSLGIGLQLIASISPVVPLIIMTLGWTVAGLGIGFAHATVSVLAFSQAPERQEGAVSSALQLADQFVPALSAGAAGALFAFATRGAWSESGGFTLAVGLSFVLALSSAAAAYRLKMRQARLL